jgi:hypothetical protein
MSVWPDTISLPFKQSAFAKRLRVFYDSLGIGPCFPVPLNRQRVRARISTVRHSASLPTAAQFAGLSYGLAFPISFSRDMCTDPLMAFGMAFRFRFSERLAIKWPLISSLSM